MIVYHMKDTLATQILKNAKLITVLLQIKDVLKTNSVSKVSDALNSESKEMLVMLMVNAETL